MNKYNKCQPPEQKPKQSSTNFPNSSKILKEVKLLSEVRYSGQDRATDSGNAFRSSEDLSLYWISH